MDLTKYESKLFVFTFLPYSATVLWLSLYLIQMDTTISEVYKVTFVIFLKYMLLKIMFYPRASTNVEAYIDIGKVCRLLMF